MGVQLLGVSRGARVQPSSGELAAAAPAGEAAQAAAAAAAGGRGRGPPPGARRRPVGFHDPVLGLEPGIVPAPRLSGRRGRRADRSPETRVLVLDVLHLDALAGVEPGLQPSTAALRSSGSG